MSCNHVRHNYVMPTPVSADRLESMLTGYDPVLKEELVSGFAGGFKIGFRGEVNSDSSVKNLQSTVKLKSEVSCALDKEVKLGRMAGPFSSPPFESFQLNPIGMVPKKDPNKFRMIVDLSFPPGKSINDGIDDSHAQVHYPSVNDAIKALLSCGPKAYMAKTDIEQAFRLIPLAASQYHMLCVKWDGVYYFDKTLPMGCRSSCKIFQSLSEALKFIAAKHGIAYLINYLDDFLIVAPSYTLCLEALREFRAICVFLGIPLAADKTFLPVQVMVFLGLEFDSVAEVVRLPQEKLIRCREGIAWLLSKKCYTLQNILGLLSFACSVIVPGRAFLRRLFALTIGVKKPHFFVKLTSAAKEDLRVWQHFLHAYNGVSLYKEEMFLSEKVCHFFTDSSKTLGCGACFGTRWFSLPWPGQWWRDQNITLLELVPIVLALEVWGEHIRNHCLVLHTDNFSLMHVINSQSSKEDLVMCLIRRLVLKALHANVLIKAEHISGVNNVWADALSRLQVSRFLELHPSADKVPSSVTPLPQSLDCKLKL